MHEIVTLCIEKLLYARKSYFMPIKLLYARNSYFMHEHDIYTVNGITIRTLRLDFTRNYNVLSFRHNVSQQYLMVCWLWRLGPCLNSTLWVRSSPGAFSNFFVGGSKVDPKLHPIHKGTCGDTIHSINTMLKPLLWTSEYKCSTIIRFCKFFPSYTLLLGVFLSPALTYLPTLLLKLRKIFHPTLLFSPTLIFGSRDLLHRKVVCTHRAKQIN